MSQGCLFDALVLAESLYTNQPEKLASIKAHLMATRSAQHPLSTLNSVAANKPVPLLVSFCFHSICMTTKHQTFE